MKVNQILQAEKEENQRDHRSELLHLRITVSGKKHKQMNKQTNKQTKNPINLKNIGEQEKIC